MGLKDKLIEFNKASDSLKGFKGENLKKELDNRFMKLAPSFLYGGYLSVKNKVNGNMVERYRIYIYAVEFYFHCEEDSPLLKDRTEEEIKFLKDPIVYHSNLKWSENAGEHNKLEDLKVTEENEIPYFEIMTLNTHDSGYDITFENEDLKYRASVLIREYIVCAVENGNEKPIPGNAGEKSKNQSYDNRSTYLKRYLNGFSIDGENCWIKWEDREDGNIKVSKVESKPNEYIDSQKRKGVKKFDPEKKENYRIWERKDTDDDREWKFRRTVYPNFKRIILKTT